jgi:hypothetical protein
MKNQIVRLLAVASLFALACSATIIPFGSDLINEGNSVTGTNVVINAHPAWGSLPGYSWVSYADTGSPGSVSPPNASIPGTPTAVFYEYLPAMTGSMSVTVFADDTADVYLFDAANPTGLLLKAANPVQDGACAAGPIGCEPKEGWSSGWVPVDPSGPAWLEIHAYQRGGGPFGVLYGGEAQVVPEPGTYLLLGAGLIGMGLLRRMRASRQ